MGKNGIRIMYSLVNVNTNTVFNGIMVAKANNFFDIADDLPSVIKDRIPKILKEKLPAEDPSEWSVLGFQDWKEYNNRVQRAKEQMSKCRPD